eukprot:SAG31_NODE_550_length_14214_cov_3.054269_11_plen_76_part_00
MLRADHMLEKYLRDRWNILDIVTYSNAIAMIVLEIVSRYEFLDGLEHLATARPNGRWSGSELAGKKLLSRFCAHY